MRKIIIVPLMCICAFGLCACSTTSSNSTENRTYKTQNANSALEYSVYMNKQITVYTNQLTTHMTLLQNSDNTYKNIIPLAEESLNILQTTLDEVIITYPSFEAEDDRETTITLMETTIKNMEDYIATLKEGKSAIDFIDKFQNDYFALTGMASLYYK